MLSKSMILVENSWNHKRPLAIPFGEIVGRPVRRDGVDQDQVYSRVHHFHQPGVAQRGVVQPDHLAEGAGDAVERLAQSLLALRVQTLAGESLEQSWKVVGSMI